MVKVAFEASALLYRQMGIASYVRHLLAALALTGEGVDFVLLLNDFRRNPRRAAAYLPGSARFRRRATRLPARLWRGLFLDWRLPIELLSGSLDILHVPDCVAPRPRRAKLVVTVHDLLDFVMPELFPQRLRDPSFSRYYDWKQAYVSRTLGLADHVIAVSENTKADILRFFGLPEERVSVIPYGLASHFRPIPPGEERRATLQRYGVADGGFLLYVGRLEDRKNAKTLFRALRLLLDRGHRIPRLVVCGWQAHPAETGDALRTLAELRLEEAIQLVDYVPTQELPCFYSAATALVYPSVYEGFGLPPLEAMGCGTPVVASGSSSLPEVVGDAALRPDPGDVDALAQAVGRVLEDGDLRAELREKGLRRAAAFSWERAAEATLEVYRRIAA